MNRSECLESPHPPPPSPRYQTNTFCKLSVNHRQLAPICQNLHERQGRKLLGMQCNKMFLPRAKTKMIASFERQQCDWVTRTRAKQTRLSIQQWNASIFWQFCLALPENNKKFSGVDFSSTRARTKVLASFEAGVNLPNLPWHVNITSLKHRSRYRSSKHGLKVDFYVSFFSRGVKFLFFLFFPTFWSHSYFLLSFQETLLFFLWSSSWCTKNEDFYASQ